MKFFWSLVRQREWWGVADCISHALHFPGVARKPICDAWDRYLGVTDDEMDRRR